MPGVWSGVVGSESGSMLFGSWGKGVRDMLLSLGLFDNEDEGYARPIGCRGGDPSLSDVIRPEDMLWETRFLLEEVVEEPLDRSDE